MILVCFPLLLYPLKKKNNNEIIHTRRKHPNLSLGKQEDKSIPVKEIWGILGHICKFVQQKCFLYLKVWQVVCLALTTWWSMLRAACTALATATIGEHGAFNFAIINLYLVVFLHSCFTIKRWCSIALLLLPVVAFKMHVGYVVFTGLFVHSIFSATACNDKTS